MLVVTATAVIRLRSLFAAVMLTGVYSLVSASFFVALDAIDVAFTEAAVGAGISTVLALGTLSLTQKTEKEGPRQHALGLAVVLVTGAVLFYATFDMPHFADPGAPIHRHVAPEYVARSIGETGIVNVVTSLLASYRGYDTWGETTVIFTAAMGVMLLLGSGREERTEDAR